jgi:hypothetical protein
VPDEVNEIITEDEASEIGTREVCRVYGDDAEPISKPRIGTLETAVESYRRRRASLLQADPELLEVFNRFAEYARTTRPFRRWQRQYVVWGQRGERVKLVTVIVDLGTGEVSVLE